jgi:hypothetical protein
MKKTLIERYEVTNGAGDASVLLNNIPQTYTDLLVLVSARNTVVADEFYIYPNSNTSNLSYRLLRGNGSTVITANVHRFYPTVSSDTANTFANGQIYIPNYTSSSAKSFSLDSVSENNGTTAYASIEAMLWNDTTAITSLLFQLNSGNIAQYSSFSLYGITAGNDGITTVS